MKAMVRPSGETVILAPDEFGTMCRSPRSIANCVDDGGAALLSSDHVVITAVKAITSVAIAQGTHDVRIVDDAVVAGAADSTVPTVNSKTSSSCSLRSCALCSRSSRSFWRQLCTTRARLAGIPGCSALTKGGSTAKICPIRLACVLPVNAGFPVAISNSITPKEKMSERSSASRPWICSGDMYATVPITEPALDIGEAGEAGLDWVMAAVNTDCDPLPAAAAAAVVPIGFASPKSSSLAEALVNITLPGLRSRC